MSLLNDPLVVAFERATLTPDSFSHRQHLYVAWCYLEQLPLEEALARYVRHLRALTVALGVPQKFHATITWAWVLVLHEAMQAHPRVDFDTLVRRTPALLEGRSLLLSFYDCAQLDSDLARERFVLPRPLQSR